MIKEITAHFLPTFMPEEPIINGNQSGFYYDYDISFFLNPIGFPGFPTITVLGVSTLLVTTDPAPIAHPSAIIILPKIFAPGPMYTSFPIVGTFSDP